MQHILWFTFLYLPAITVARKECSFDDNECLLRSGSMKMAPFYSGNCSINLESSDPIYEPYIQYTSPDIEYTMRNVSMYGFSTCAMDYIEINQNQPFYTGYFVCPFISIEAACSIKGQIGDLFVLGEGKCIINHYDIRLGVFSDLDIYLGKDDQKHMQFANYLLNIDVRDNVRYEFREFRNGTQDISCIATDCANNNWSKLYPNIQIPLLKELIGKVVANANVYFEYFALRDVFSQ